VTATASGSATESGRARLPARYVLAAAALAFAASAAAIGRTVEDLAVFALTLPLYLAPGWPVARWYAGDDSDRTTRVVLAALFGFLAGGLVCCGLRLAGVSSPAISLAACVAAAVAVGALTRGPQSGIVRFTPLTSGDRAALGALLILAAAIVGPAFARVGVDTPSGPAYRAYFIADLFGFMSVVAELIKGHTPPLNPYNAGEALPYYWAYFTYPAIFASIRRTAPIERGILLAQLATAATLVSVWFVVVRNLGRSTASTAWTWTLVLISSSFEGLAFLAWSVSHHRSIEGFRYVNIDGLTRWWWGLPPVDGMHRALWYTPQHATAFTFGFLTLATLVRARDRNGLARRTADGLLLGGAFLFSSFTGLLVVAWYALTEVTLLVASGGRDARRWLASCAFAALVVVLAVGMAYLLGMIQPIEGGMIVKVNRYLLPGPWRFVGLNFGPLLLLAPFALRRLVRDERAAAIAVAVLVLICIAALLMLEAPGHDNTYLPFRTGNFFFLTLAVTTAFALDEFREWSDPRRRIASGAVAAIALAAAPTVAFDWYNTRDIDNVAMNPGGFPWTVHVTRSEQSAMRWIRDTLPADAVVQSDALLRGRGSWALIPAFGQRRMATGIVLFEPNPSRLNTRLTSIDRIFRGDTTAEAFDACQQLGIDYLYFGEVEAGIESGETDRFQHDAEHFRLAYAGRDARIYEVRHP
jgi:hypothetical protein